MTFRKDVPCPTFYPSVVIAHTFVLIFIVAVFSVLQQVSLHADTCELVLCYTLHYSVYHYTMYLLTHALFTNSPSASFCCTRRMIVSRRGMERVLTMFS